MVYITKARHRVYRGKFEGEKKKLISKHFIADNFARAIKEQMHIAIQHKQNHIILAKTDFLVDNKPKM